MSFSYLGFSRSRRLAQRRDRVLLAQLPSNMEPKGWAILPTGGYGRFEVTPFSDSDILILVSTEQDLRWIEDFVHRVWELGPPLGYSIRTLSETWEAMDKDVKSLASYLDARFLVGDEGLFRSFHQDRRKAISGTKGVRFLEQKWEEREHRLGQLGMSVRMQEPELKEGRGGLRDYQFLRWVMYVKTEMSAHSFWTWFGRERGARLAKDIHQGADWLMHVRSLLHETNERPVNRLGFSDQEIIAKKMGFGHSKSGRAAEKLMTLFFTHADQIATTLENWHVNGFERFVGESKKKRRCFPREMLQRLRTIDSSPVEISTLASELSAFASGKIAHEEKKAFYVYFLESFEDPSVLPIILRVFDRSGLFSRLFPEWKRIRNRIQHNYLHAFSIDEHLLRAVEELCRGILSGEFVGLSLERDRKIVLLAACLHDIGKGSEKDHVLYGCEIAKHVLDRLEIGRKDQFDVLFLIKHHLLLSHTAQRSDLGDRKVIERFARVVRTRERLNWLYALTVSDIRATGSGVYTEWKASLLRNLVQQTRNFWQDEGVTQQNMTSIRSHLIGQMERSANVPKFTKTWAAFGRQLPLRYFSEVTQNQILQDDRLLSFKPVGNQLVLEFSESQNVGEVVLTLVAKDQSGFFEKVARVLAHEDWNVRRALIYTTKSGWVLDRFVLDLPRRFEHRAHRLRESLQASLKMSRERLRENVKKSRLPSRATPYIPKQIVLREDKRRNRMIIEIYARDRKGLMADFASCFSVENLGIQQAQIVTEGQRVADIFFVTPQQGRALPNKGKLKKLQERLMSVVST